MLSKIVSDISILAIREAPFEQLQREFQRRAYEPPAGNVYYIAVGAVVVILVLWGLAKILDYRQRRRPYRSPFALFWTLCGRHRLSWRQTWLLWRLARARKLADPALLFADPDVLRPIHGFERHRESLELIWEAVFGDLETELEDYRQRQSMGSAKEDDAEGQETLDEPRDTDARKIPVRSGPTPKAENESSASRRDAGPVRPPIETPKLDVAPWTEVDA
ncbi:MAG: hypothetical protein D6741_17780 [Planctomycetota bacterium]|nr:MAG: hypothetical protein D6741_17780 [Planctomycetota bacterium]